MRRVKARRLWRLARELMARRGIKGSHYEVVPLRRGSARMLKLNRQREAAIQHLMMHRREQLTELERVMREKEGDARAMVSREIAEILVPPPAEHGDTVVCTGVRAAYQQLKRGYREGKVRGV